MKIHFKKILVSFIAIVGFVVYALYQRNIGTGQELIGAVPEMTTTTVAQTSADNPAVTTEIQTAASNPPLDTSNGDVAYESQDSNEYGDGEDGEDEEDGYSSSQTTQTTVNNTTTTAPATTDTASSGTTTNNTSGSSSTTTSAGLYKDGQFDGISADAYYGFVQVRAIVQNGNLTDVQFLSYPNDRSYSVQINTYAMPLLKSEAIKVQSAQVNIISGATNTSRAFMTSLSSALTQAQV